VDTRLHVRVSPGARRSGVVGRYGDGWKIRIAAAPERGRANSALVAYLAAQLGLAAAQVRVVTGAGARDKIVELSGIGLDEAERLLAAAGETVSA
jgi:uncharacterized protein (TIGR00251 family)